MVKVKLDPTNFSLKGTKKVYKSLINQTFDVPDWSVNVNLLLIMETMKVQGRVKVGIEPDLQHHHDDP